jgi:hypothetical protein
MSVISTPPGILNETAPIEYTPLMAPGNATFHPDSPEVVPIIAPGVVTANNQTRAAVSTTQVMNNETKPRFASTADADMGDAVGSGAAKTGLRMVYQSLVIVGLLAVPVAMFM